MEWTKRPMVEWSSRLSYRFIKSSNGGVVELVKLSNCRIVVWWNGGMVEL